MLGASNAWNKNKLSRKYKKLQVEQRTRAMRRIITEAKQDLMCGLPFAALFCVPIVGYATPAVVFAFQRQAPASLITIVNKVNCHRQDAEDRQLLIRHLLSVAEKSIQNKVAPQHTISALAQLNQSIDSGKPIAWDQVLQADSPVRKLMHSLSLSNSVDNPLIHQMNAYQCISMLRYFSRHSVLHFLLSARQLRARCQALMQIIRDDDAEIEKEGGYAKLNIIELISCCAERGLYAPLLTFEAAEFAQLYLDQLDEIHKQAAVKKIKFAEYAQPQCLHSHPIQKRLLAELQKWRQLAPPKDILTQSDLTLRAFAPVLVTQQLNPADIRQ